MISQISTYMVSMVLGIMLFFSFVVAPVTFTVLDVENSRKFIRKIFPYYYNVNLVISFLILFFYVILKTFSLNFYLILAVVILFALSSYILIGGFTFFLVKGLIWLGIFIVVGTGLFNSF